MMKKIMIKKGLLIILVLIISLQNTAYAGTRSINKTPIPVLMYHHLDKKSSNRTTVKPGDFKMQMLFLKKSGYNTITIHDLILAKENKKPLPKHPILITFDDGYLSNYRYAYPILKELGMKATFFIVAAECGKTPGRTPHFTWDQAKQMYNSGTIDIQSHSYKSHGTILTKKGLKPALINRIYSSGIQETVHQYQLRITNDLKQSKNTIEQHIGNKVAAFSYPYGAYNFTTERACKKVGFKFAFLAKGGINYLSDNPYRFKRINVSGFDTGYEIAKKAVPPSKKPQKTLITVNKKAVPSKELPIKINGRFFIPVSLWARQLNYNYNWNHIDKQLTIKKGWSKAMFQPYLLNNSIINIKGHMFAPVDFYSQNFDCKITLNTQTRGSVNKIDIQIKKKSHLSSLSAFSNLFLENCNQSFISYQLSIIEFCR
jgi:peptidoglycan/xylan/chitin deacetylase (PgdA/CDA1 family)